MVILIKKFSSREVEGPALRNLGNHKVTLVPIPAETASTDFLEDEVIGRLNLSIQRGFLIMDNLMTRLANQKNQLWKKTHQDPPI